MYLKHDEVVLVQCDRRCLLGQIFYILHIVDNTLVHVEGVEHENIEAQP